MACVCVASQRVHTFVEGIVRIRLAEEKLKTKANGVDGEDGFPVVTQNVQTHIALRVDVGMVNLHNYISGLSCASSATIPSVHT